MYACFYDQLITYHRFSMFELEFEFGQLISFPFHTEIGGKNGKMCDCCVNKEAACKQNITNAMVLGTSEVKTGFDPFV